MSLQQTQQAQARPEPVQKTAGNDDFKKNLEAMLARPNRGTVAPVEMMSQKQHVKGFGDDDEDDDFFNVGKRKQIMTITAPRKAATKYNVDNFDF